MKKEVWKTILKHPEYQVSNHGRVRALQRTLIGRHRNGKVFQYTKPLRLKVVRMTKDYAYVNLHSKGVRVNAKVHRLVAEAFIPNPKRKETVNHKNGLKYDNRVENLEWATRKEQTQHALSRGLLSVGSSHPSAKLSVHDVQQIRRLVRHATQRSIAKKFDVSPAVICLVLKGLHYRNVS